MTEKSRLRRSISRWASSTDQHARDLRREYADDARDRIGEAPDRTIVRLRGTLRTHAQATGSTVAARLLDRWHSEVRRFKKVMPRDYKRVLEAARIAEENGLDVDEAIMAAAHG